MVNGKALLDEPPQRIEESRPKIHREPGIPIQLHGVKWRDYVALCDLIGEVHVRTSFIDGEVEIMTVSSEHEIWASLIGQLIEALTMALKMPRQGLGTTTFRREDLERGLEPDRCYYLASGSRVHNWMRVDLSVDPPPDLAVEVEITSSAAKRMAIYASLGVPELWRFDGKALIIHHLAKTGEYAVAGQSLSFPFLPIKEFTAFLQRRGQLSESLLVGEFFDWVKQQIAAGWPSGSK
jgi:Uma2 family endonuclease